jgi:penicillin amidase
MKYARLLKWIGIIGCAVILAVLLAAAWAWNRIEDSLPPLDGEQAAPGLSAQAQLDRDEAGVAIITAASEADAIYALGFAHGQDRFFQMDLSRRRSAGELSGLFGKAALPLDRSAVVHRFRVLSRQALSLLPPEQRELLTAYTAGVNAGLASLPRSPWEYAMLRHSPKPWTEEDCGLTFYAMVLELQNSTGTYEHTVSTLRDIMGRDAVDFFNPLVGPQDSTFDGSVQALGAPPSAAIINLRSDETLLEPELGSLPLPEHHVVGSNAFVVTGSQTSHGAGLLAGDPHLGLKLPNTWYRAQLNWTRPDGSAHRVEGVSLPGVPGIVIGSNGSIAWSFTNATVDTSDLVQVDLNQIAPELLYHYKGDSVEFEERTDTIVLPNGDTEDVTTTWTAYGPIVGRDVRGKTLALKWVFHDPAALNFDILGLATADSVAEATAIAAGSGMPNQNLFVVDRSGDAAWALTGKLPRRFGYDGRFPVSWTFGDRGWEGYLPTDERPVITCAPGDVLWSGNQRKLGGDALILLGDDGYTEPARAAQIESRLRELAGRTLAPEDLLAVQLDDHAAWAQRWSTLLVETLAEATPDSADHADLRQLLAAWDGRAAWDSAAYRFVRRWHRLLARRTLEPIFAECRRKNSDFRWWLLRYDEALWALHRDEPTHLLASSHHQWRELRQSVLAELIAEAHDQSGRLENHLWGEANRLKMKHPFSHIVPGFLSQYLDMPYSPQNGDSRLPRVARPTHGASLRMVVAPGHETEGILHLPAGQSGNPLSIFYRAGHDAWLLGNPTPFQPDPAQHRLILTP